MHENQSKMMQISLKAQDKAEKEIQNWVKMRSADKIPEMMPPQWQIERSYAIALVEESLKEYHKCLQEELRKQGLNLPDFSND